MSKKNSIHTSWDRTSNLPICSGPRERVRYYTYGSSSDFAPSDTLTDFKDRVLLEKLRVPQLFRKFPTFRETEML